MAVLSLMRPIFSRKEFWKSVEKCMVFTLEKCRNCSAPGVEGRGGEVKNDNIALVYQHKKTPTPQRLRESF